jgi:transcription antitermination factor NusB
MGDPDDPSRSETSRTYTRRARHLGRPKRDDTDDPRRSRERALKILFQADLRGVRAEEVLRQVDADADSRAMLDDLDDLDDLDGLQDVVVDAAAGVEGPATAAPEIEAAGAVDETEAQRIWREERERAQRGEATDRAPDGTSGKGEEATDTVPSGVPPVDGFTHTLVQGVNDHGQQIDDLISRYARRWTINRMPVVDRTVLRLATYELLHEPTAPAVVINEAVELVKSLSTDDSGRYVNGVLESIRRDIADRRASEPQDV